MRRLGASGSRMAYMYVTSMLSGHLEGRYSRCLSTHALKVCWTLMFTGYSAPGDGRETGRLVACEVDQYVADLHKLCSKSLQGAKSVQCRSSARDTVNCGTGVIRLRVYRRQAGVCTFPSVARLCFCLTGSSALTIHCSGPFRSPSELGTEKRSPSSTHCENDPRVEQVLLCKGRIDHHPEFQ